MGILGQGGIECQVPERRIGSGWGSAKLADSRGIHADDGCWCDSRSSTCRSPNGTAGHRGWHGLDGLGH